MRDKNKEPWRLTSQRRPQEGHPRARGNKAQTRYIQTTSQKRNNMNTSFSQHIYNPNQGFHNDSKIES